MHEDFVKFGSPSIRLIEELAELTMAISKLERFGPWDSSPFDVTLTPNKDRVLDEIKDVKIAITNFEDWLNNIPKLKDGEATRILPYEG
jgi:hypothetical protein